ncbi:hypothetical protein SAMN05660657_04957 [Geodermatophilus amargosae]|uniref:Uncharacterized protein n=1 Tax=Geodermatophilus amargosae TaxID=1296565 RepID=A0A1I7CVZ6_9ACTN|nr:hypothetical protein [Geodermatophilus amargosae]SFU03584.1 hypothetical protein SAMN05660657_04957 [Geodermatophilus amargosae]
MTLFVQLSFTGTQFAVLSHLVLIGRCESDPADLIEDVPGNPTIKRFKYRKKRSGPAQDLLDAMCNSVATDVVISGVDAGFVLPDGSPITATGGATLPFGGTAMRIVYDVTDAGSANYHVAELSGTPGRVTHPAPAILFHELAHAHHAAVGDAPPPGPARVRQTIEHENAFRLQVGLPLRSPTDQGVGVGYAAPAQVVCPSTLEPDAMPVEGGLRMRAPTTSIAADVWLDIGGKPATDVVLRDGWVYGTTPPLPAGDHPVTLTQGGLGSPVGTLHYTEELLLAVRAAVSAYGVALQEAIVRLPGALTAEARAIVTADAELRGHAVDTVAHARADARGESLESLAVDGIWLAAADVLAALQKEVSDGHVIA